MVVFGVADSDRVVWIETRSTSRAVPRPVAVEIPCGSTITEWRLKISARGSACARISSST